MGKVLAWVLIAVGLVCLGFGINSTVSLSDEVTEAVTGRYTENTMLYIIGGIAMIVGGAGLLIKFRKG
ncbi:MAG: DUF3185 family protein [Waddliaceae bacterium]